MKFLMQFSNGTIVEDECDHQPMPPSFHLHAFSGCTFWFKMADTLPSGAVLYVETTREEAQEIWSSGHSGET